MTQELVKQENIQTIVQSAPQSYNDNKLSREKCIEAGQAILAAIQAQGMTDELDQQAALFIEKARKTVKKMNERRSPVTKLFDDIRKEFTAMENAIDPTKADTIPFKLQQLRNQFAAKKREEAERIRQEELRLQRKEKALTDYRQAAEDDYRRQFDRQITADINTLTGLNQSLTIENFDSISEEIKNFKVTLGNEWFQQCQSYAHKPFEISDAEAIDIRQTTLNRLSKQFKEQYAAEVGEYRDTIVDALPSKRRELERMAKANAEEQARLKADLEAREAAEARRLEEERRRKEEEAKAAQQVRQTASEMDGLFAQANAATASYQPKTAVKKRIAVEKADGILSIVSMWWSKEGQFLPLDELSKIFKKQITFCERLANDKDSPELISSPYVRYEEEVKAK